MAGIVFVLAWVMEDDGRRMGDQNELGLVLNKGLVRLVKVG